MTGYSEGIHGGVEGLFGEAGDDYLVSFGADQMFGGADNDTLVGGLQTYIMDGGSGNDKIYVDPNNQITVQIFTGSGNDEVRGYGSSFVDVKYRFTMDYDPYLGGEDGHLISVFDRGDYFEVLTSEGMDKIYDIGFIMFESDMVAGTWNMFFLDEGIAWINPNGPPSSQAMPLSGPYGDAPFTAYDDPMLAMHDYGMPTWKMASIHEMDYHLV